MLHFVNSIFVVRQAQNVSISSSVGKHLWEGGMRAVICTHRVGIVSISGQAPGAHSLFFPSTHHQSNEFLIRKVVDWLGFLVCLFFLKLFVF